MAKSTIAASTERNTAKASLRRILVTESNSRRQPIPDDATQKVPAANSGQELTSDDEMELSQLQDKFDAIFRRVMSGHELYILYGTDQTYVSGNDGYMSFDDYKFPGHVHPLAVAKELALSLVEEEAE